MITWESLKEQNTLRMPSGNSHILLKAQKVPNINTQKVLPSKTTKLKCPDLLITSDRWWGMCCILMGLDYCYFFFSIILFIYGCAVSSLLCVFSSSCGEWEASLQLWCLGFSRWGLLLLRAQALGTQASGLVDFSCSAACAVFPDQGSNRCPLHWQADSSSLYHQGSLAQTVV